VTDCDKRSSLQQLRKKFNSTGPSMDYSPKWLEAKNEKPNIKFSTDDNHIKLIFYFFHSHSRKKLFQPSLLFASKAAGLPANIRLGCDKHSSLFLPECQ
jgi:hypothetical protein